MTDDDLDGLEDYDRSGSDHVSPTDEAAGGGEPGFVYHVVEVANGGVPLIVEGPGGTARIRFEGYATTTLTWNDVPDGGRATCAVGPLTPDATAITGVVRTPSGAALGDVNVQGCGGSATTDDSGSYVLEPIDGPCDLMPSDMRTLGLISGKRTHVEVRAGEINVVDLTFEPDTVVGLELRDGDIEPAIFLIQAGIVYRCAQDLDSAWRVTSVNGAPPSDYDPYELGLALADRYSSIEVSAVDEPCPRLH